MTDTITQKFLDDFPEVNMANFNDDDVAALNAWGIAAHTLLNAALAQQADCETTGVCVKSGLYCPSKQSEQVPVSTVNFLPHDDHLRFIQRVLESDAPKSDRADAAKMVSDIRRSLYVAASAAKENS